MSRIYEALQKAETEKGAGSPFTPPRSSSIHTDASTIAVADPVSRVESFPESAPTHHSVHSRIDPSEVVTRPWSPNQAALPALEERGPAVEQFRSLRSRIYEMRDIKPLRSILVSSGLPQEGKSFVAANLAISLARNRNSKVLLVDGDMRRYTLHKLLGCDPHPGLADYLAGRAEMQDVMQRASEISTTSATSLPGVSNLTLVPGGDGGDRASDLSASPRFAELIQEACSVYDWIIVDSSPVLPVSDAINLARATDGVLLVARAGVTDLTTAQNAQAQLKAAHLLGVVLNAVPKAPQLGSYYGYDTSNDKPLPGTPQ